MAAFDEHAYDILLSTNIIESGLDIPSANTLIVHRSDRFGLAQLYQLRGPHRPRQGPRLRLSHPAVGQDADRDGAAPARGDADPGPTGRRLHAGEPRSRHPRRRQSLGRGAVGPYPRGRRRALSAAPRRGDRQRAERRRRHRRGRPTSGRRRSPSARRCSFPRPMSPTSMCASASIAASPRWWTGARSTRFAAELIDRFGQLPQEVDNLLEIIAIKRLCRDAGVDKVEAGPKGALIAFRQDRFANPLGSGPLHRGERRDRQAPPRSATRHHAQLGSASRPPQGHQRAPPAARQNSRGTDRGAQAGAGGADSRHPSEIASLRSQ